MTQPHATTADIQAILTARAAAVRQGVTIPALPLPHTAQPSPASASGPGIAATAPQQGHLTAQSAQAHQQPASPPAAPVSDTDLSAFLTSRLPQIQAAAVALATPPFVWSEVLTLGQVVSQAVHDGLPLAQGAEAAQIVQVVTGYAYDHYLLPALPTNIKPFAPLLRPLVLQGIEAAYQLAVKRKLSR